MRLCVFCGSNPGTNPMFIEVAAALGSGLAAMGAELIYGGGHLGLMGAVADATLAAGGRVTGVIPAAMWDREIGHRGLTELHVVANMHERKQMMSDLADGFLALPGGFGTFEELFEQLTWLQLGHHRKPVVALDIDNFYRSAFDLVSQAITSGFVKPIHGELFRRATTVESALALVAQPIGDLPEKWID